MHTWTGDGGIRLSTDEGPPARAFIDEDNDDEEEETSEKAEDERPEKGSAEGSEDESEGEAEIWEVCNLVSPS